MERYGTFMGRKYWEYAENGQKSVNPHKKNETTTIEITEEMKDYLNNFNGRNFTERIGELDWKQNCAKAGTDGCNQKATNAFRMHLADDLFVAVPLCSKHLKQVKIDQGEKVYE